MRDTNEKKGPISERNENQNSTNVKETSEILKKGSKRIASIRDWPKKTTRTS